MTFIAAAASDGDAPRRFPPVRLQIQPPEGQRKENHIHLQQLEIIDDERKSERERHEQFGEVIAREVSSCRKPQALAVDQPGDQIESPE